MLFRVTPVSLVYYLPAGLAFQVVGFCFGMFLDLKRPMLKWTHPQQAMKNNTNALGAMGGTAAVVIVVGAPAAFAIAKGASPFLVGCGVALVAIVLAAVLLPRLLTFADRQYAGGLELAGRSRGRARARAPCRPHFFRKTIPSLPASTTTVDAVGHLAGEHLPGERVLHQALDRALQRPGAVLRVEAGVGEQRLRLRRSPPGRSSAPSSRFASRPSWMSTIFRMSSRSSRLKKIVSSMRFRNSGLKVVRSSAVDLALHLLDLRRRAG